MKSCREIEAGLYIFADRLEKENMPLEFSDHIENCERCRNLYASLERVEATIAEYSEVPLPPESYFEHLPTEILAKLPAEKSARKGLAFSARLADFFGRPFVKPVFALTVFALIAITVWQVLPDGARFTFVDNRKKLLRTKQEQLAETTQQAQSLATGESEASKISDKSTTPREEESSVTTGVAAPKYVPIVQSGKPKSDSATSLLAQENLQQQDVPAAEPSTLGDLALRAIPPEALENIRLAEGTAKEADKKPLTPEAFKALQEEFQESKKMAATSFRMRSKTKETADVDRLGRASFASFERGAMTFSDYLRLAQMADADQERTAIWRRFLETTRDSTQYALGLVQLARANYAIASQSNEVYELANAVDWFKKNAAALKPLMGEDDFNRQLAALRARLQDARTGKLRED